MVNILELKKDIENLNFPLLKYFFEQNDTFRANFADEYLGLVRMPSKELFVKSFMSTDERYRLVQAHKDLNDEWILKKEMHLNNIFHDLSSENKVPQEHYAPDFTASNLFKLVQQIDSLYYLYLREVSLSGINDLPLRYASSIIDVRGLTSGYLSTIISFYLQNGFDAKDPLISLATTNLALSLQEIRQANASSSKISPIKLDLIERLTEITGSNIETTAEKLIQDIIRCLPRPIEIEKWDYESSFTAGLCEDDGPFGNIDECNFGQIRDVSENFPPIIESETELIFKSIQNFDNVILDLSKKLIKPEFDAFLTRNIELLQSLKIRDNKSINVISRFIKSLQKYQSASYEDGELNNKNENVVSIDPAKRKIFKDKNYNGPEGFDLRTLYIIEPIIEDFKEAFNKPPQYLIVRFLKALVDNGYIERTGNRSKYLPQLATYYFNDPKGWNPSYFNKGGLNGDSYRGSNGTIFIRQDANGYKFEIPPNPFPDKVLFSL